MKRRILAISLALTMLLGTVSVAATDASDFTDMPDNYATESLEAAVANGLLTGDNGAIMPTDALTRAQMAAILVRAFGGEESANLSAYSDVSASAWYYDELSTAVYMGLFQGSGSTMSPDSAITRQEAFVVLARAFALDSGDTDVLDSYADGSSVADWAAEEVAAMIATGFVQGNGDYLYPTSTITRQDFAVVMDRMVETYISEAGEYSELPDGSVMINVPDVTLSDMTIDGDLVLGDGVGDGDITLDNVIVTGHMVVRGGGTNSIIVTGSSEILGTVKIAKVDGEVRVSVEGDASVGVIYVNDGLDDIIVEGAFESLVVDYSSIVYAVDATIGTIDVHAEEAIVVLKEGTTVSDATIYETATDAQIILEEETSVGSITVAAEGSTVSVGESATVESITTAETATDATIEVGENATVESLEVAGADTSITVSDGATVETVTTTETATDATIEVADGATVTTVEAAAEGTTIIGDGTVESVTVTADNTTVETEGTTVEVADDVSGTTAGGDDVDAGTTTTTDTSSTSTTTTTSSSSSSSSSSTYYTVTFDDQDSDDETSAGSAYIKSGNSTTLPTPTYADYTFVEWNTASDGSGIGYEAGSSYTVSSTHTLYAIWGYTVYFYDATDSDEVKDYATVAVATGKSVAEPSEPSKDKGDFSVGFIFDDWYTTSACTEPYDFEDAITANTAVYGKWVFDMDSVINAGIDASNAALTAAAEKALEAGTGEGNEYALLGSLDETTKDTVVTIYDGNIFITDVYDDIVGVIVAAFQAHCDVAKTLDTNDGTTSATLDLTQTAFTSDEMKTFVNASALSNDGANFTGLERISVLDGQKFTATVTDLYGNTYTYTITFVEGSWS